MKFRRDPVPHSGRPRWRLSRKRASGVSGGSRVVPHRYADEGDNGPAHRREIRRKETRLWRQELED